MAQGRQAPAGFPERLIASQHKQSSRCTRKCGGCFLRGTILNALRVALRIISGKISIICGSETPAGVSEPLFHEWGTPSVIACGDATFPKGTASAVAGNFTALPKGVPLRADFPRPGEDVAQRQKGESGERSEPEGVIPVPQIFPPCQRLPPVKTGGAERPQTFRSPKFKSYFRYCCA